VLKFGFVALVSFIAGFLVSHRRKPPLPAPAVMAAGEEKTPLERATELMFMIGWLISWTSAIILALGILARGGAGGSFPLLIGWLLAAIAGWISAVAKLLNLLNNR